MENIKTTKRFNNNSGAVLVLSMVISSALIIISAGIMNLVIAESMHTQRSIDELVAMHVAEAGVEKGLWELNHNSGTFDSNQGWTGTNPKIKTEALENPAGDTIGYYTIQITDPSGLTPTVEASSFVPSLSSPKAQRTVAVTLGEGQGQSFTMAAFGNFGIEMDSNSCTDSYDSTLGIYSNSNKGTDGDIGTNAITSNPESIELDSNVNVKGDIFTGPGSDPLQAIEEDGNVTITGQKLALGSEMEFPSILAPIGLAIKPSIELDSNNSMSLSSSGQYVDIRLESNSTLTIDTDVTLYIVDEFRMDSNSELILTNGAKVEIYVDGEIILNSNVDLNALGKDPSKLSLFGTDSMSSSGDDEDINLDSNATLYGTIYSKNSGIELDSNSKVFGAVMGAEIEIDSNSCIHFDTSLNNAGSLPGSGGYSLVHWFEK